MEVELEFELWVLNFVCPKMILENRSHVNMPICISKSINQFHTFLKLCTAGTYYFALHTCYIPLDILKSASFSSWGCLLWMHKLSKLWKRNAKNKCATFSFLVFTIHFKHNLRQFSEITNDKKDVIAIKKDFFCSFLKIRFIQKMLVNFGIVIKSQII